MDRLLLGDASPGEVGRELGLPSNLLAHHVKLPDQAGVIERVRSEGDHRRTYLRLKANALNDLIPACLRTAPRVVFVCTHNSARSQLAAALWKRRSKIPVSSVGTQPPSGCTRSRSPPPASTARRCHGRGPTTSTRCCGLTTLCSRCTTAPHEGLGDEAANRLQQEFDGVFGAETINGSCTPVTTSSPRTAPC